MTPYQSAHFKFGLIAPVIQDTYTDETAMAYYRRVTEKPLRRPDGTYFHYKPKSIQAWERLYRKGGMDALIKPPRKDKGTQRSLSNDAITEIYNLKEKFPRLNATQIREKLIADGIVTAKVSVRCFQRFIKEWNLKRGMPANLKDRKAFEEEYFGGMWQTDSCHFPRITGDNGSLMKTYLQLIMDDHSRMIVSAEIFFNDNAINFQSLLKRAVAAYGIPNKLYCDNGSPYVNHQTEFICGSIGTILIHTPVRDAAAKGKVERIFRTIKEQWLYGLDLSTVTSLEDFNTSLSSYVRSYNLTVHSSTEETPIDRYLKTNGRIKTPKSYDWLQECFLHRDRRNVRTDSTVRIDKRYYDAPMQFIGQTVEIRFLPGKVDSAFILHDKKCYPLRLTDKVENSRTKRSDIRINYDQMGSYGRRELDSSIQTGGDLDV
jgi:transposase InsO family protein